MATQLTSVPSWVRLGLVVLGLPNVVAGLWAIFAPRNWFESFPGFDPRLVAAEPPFNAHLVTDAGAGLFASGVVLLIAAWLADARSVQLAVVAFAAFAVPHAAYHASNAAPGLTDAENLQNTALLLVALALAVVVFVGARRVR